jgi:hypothetical protein
MARVIGMGLLRRGFFVSVGRGGVSIARENEDGEGVRDGVIGCEMWSECYTGD